MKKLKLDIELVPETSWYTNVRSEVSKDTWDRIRKACYLDAGYRCEICGGVGNKHPVECHEVWEFDDENKIQKLVGFIALCPKCHLVKHIGFAEIKGRLAEAKEHFMVVNGVGESFFNEYLKKVWKKWKKRSENDWRIKVDYRFINE